MSIISEVIYEVKYQRIKAIKYTLYERLLLFASLNIELN